jgi:hypothetical protein
MMTSELIAGREFGGSCGMPCRFRRMVDRDSACIAMVNGG